MPLFDSLFNNLRNCIIKGSLSNFNMKQTTKANNRIDGLSDSDFLSLLYSERDREHSLNQIPGWSIWAIIGAWITVLCAGYAVLKGNQSIDAKKVLYLTSALLALVLSSGSLFRLFHLNRSVDFSKVKLLSEVFPTVQFVFVFVCSLSFAIIIFITESVNPVFWLWIALLIVYCVASIIAICNRNTIVPSYYYDVVFPWEKINIVFESIQSALYLLIFHVSSRIQPIAFLSSEFELSICMVTLVTLAFIFFKIRLNDNTVSRIDDIIEGFLYKGVSREETFSQLSVNRWGYTVLDACSKELKAIKNRFQEHEEELKELQAIERSIIGASVMPEQIDVFLKKVDSILLNQRKSLKSSEELTNRLKQILKVAPLLSETTELDYLVEANNAIHSKVSVSLDRVKHIVTLVKEKQNEIHLKIDAHK